MKILIIGLCNQIGYETIVEFIYIYTHTHTHNVIFEYTLILLHKLFKKIY